MDKVEIYVCGLCYCSVCVDDTLSIEEITKDVNSQMPTGISSQWKLSKENFKGGEKNPHPCWGFTKGRSHYLFVN
jgi:hypothetical protein